MKLLTSGNVVLVAALLAVGLGAPVPDIDGSTEVGRTDTSKRGFGGPGSGRPSNSGRPGRPGRPGYPGQSTGSEDDSVDLKQYADAGQDIDNKLYRAQISGGSDVTVVDNKAQFDQLNGQRPGSAVLKYGPPLADFSTTSIKSTNFPELMAYEHILNVDFTTVDFVQILDHNEHPNGDIEFMPLGTYSKDGRFAIVDSEVPDIISEGVRIPGEEVNFQSSEAVAGDNVGNLEALIFRGVSDEVKDVLGELYGELSAGPTQQVVFQLGNAQQTDRFNIVTGLPPIANHIQGYINHVNKFGLRKEIVKVVVTPKFAVGSQATTTIAYVFGTKP